MVCPYCKFQNLRVLETRDNSETSTRRRRECENCGKRFTTYERIEKVVLNVQKRNGKIEEFDREKIKRGVIKAVKKRPVTEEQIEELVARIEHKLINKEDNTISTKEIGEMVLGELTRIDKLGALLFAAVYKEFQSLEEVQRELERLSKKI